MIYETPKLETERLILKRGAIDDYKLVYEYDFTKLRNINGEFEYVKLDPSRIVGWDIPSENSYDWIIYLKDGMIPIGNVIADRENTDINAIEIAFNMHPNYWKCGYTTEAIIEIMRFLFNSGYDNILCSYDEGNIKSKSLNEKLGFELYNVLDNAWFKNGVAITTYTCVLSKEKYRKLYKDKNKL